MSTDLAPTRSPASPAETFADLERKLGEWLTRVAEPPPEPDPQEAGPNPFQTFEERLNGLQAYLDEAEAKSEQALAPLTAEIQSLRQWLEELKLARGKLVERTAGAV